MAWFTKKEWKNRLAEFAGRRTLTDVATGASQVVDVARNEGTISQEGDAFSAANMNEFEQRILEGFTQAENATTELNQKCTNLETSFQDGCSTIASAITAMGVTTANNASPDIMASNIKKIASSTFTVGTAKKIPSNVKRCMVVMYAQSTYDNYYPGAQTVTTTKGTVKYVIQEYTDTATSNNNFRAKVTVAIVEDCAGATLTISTGAMTNVSGGYYTVY